MTTKSTKKVININTEFREKFSRLDKLAVWITQHVGTMGFFLTIFTWTLGWLTWNIFGPKEYRFDPYPGFILWLFISNMIQILLMPLLLIGQNLQGKHSEMRAESDFEINLKSEAEIQAIIKKLNEQEKILKQILEKIPNK